MTDPDDLTIPATEISSGTSAEHLNRMQARCDHCWRVETIRPAPGPSVLITVFERRLCLKCGVLEEKMWREQWGKRIPNERPITDEEREALVRDPWEAFRKRRNK